MYCKKCGTKLADGAAFCQNCGTKQGEQSIPENTQAVIPKKDVQLKRPNKKKIVFILAATAILIAVAVFVGISIFGEKELDLKKFDEENENTVSTSLFEEFASKENGFESCKISDYTEEEDPYGHAILNLQAVDIFRHDLLDGVYLSIYENEEELAQYAYADILEIIGMSANVKLLEALESPSGDFYYFEFGDGVYGDHSYCFHLEGNSMVYAIQCLQNEKDAYTYLLGRDAAGVFDIPSYNLGNSDLIDFSDQFLEDYNNR